MTAITWKTQVAPSFADSVTAQRTATDAMNNAFKQLSGSTDYFRNNNIADTVKQGATQDLDWLTQANQFTNRDTLQSDLAGIAVGKQADKAKIAKYMQNRGRQLRDREQDIFNLNTLDREARIRKNVDASGDFFKDHLNADKTVNNETGLAAWMTIPGNTQTGYNQSKTLFNANSGVDARAAQATANLLQANKDREFGRLSAKDKNAANQNAMKFDFEVAQHLDSQKTKKNALGYEALTSISSQMGGGVNNFDEGAQAQYLGMLARAQAAGLDSATASAAITKGMAPEVVGGMNKLDAEASTNLDKAIAAFQSNQPTNVNRFMQKYGFSPKLPTKDSAGSGATPGTNTPGPDLNTVEGRSKAAIDKLNGVNTTEQVNDQGNTASEQEAVDFARARSRQGNQTPAQVNTNASPFISNLSKAQVKESDLFNYNQMNDKANKDFVNSIQPIIDPIKSAANTIKNSAENAYRYAATTNLDGSPVTPSKPKSRIEQEQDKIVMDSIQSMNRSATNDPTDIINNIFKIVSKVKGKPPTEEEIKTLLSLTQ